MTRRHVVNPGHRLIGGDLRVPAVTHPCLEAVDVCRRQILQTQQRGMPVVEIGPEPPDGAEVALRGGTRADRAADLTNTPERLDKWPHKRWAPESGQIGAEDARRSAREPRNAVRRAPRGLRCRDRRPRETIPGGGDAGWVLRRRSWRGRLQIVGPACGRGIDERAALLETIEVDVGAGDAAMAQQALQLLQRVADHPPIRRAVVFAVDRERCRSGSG